MRQLLAICFAHILLRKLEAVFTCNTSVNSGWHNKLHVYIPGATCSVTISK